MRNHDDDVPLDLHALRVSAPADSPATEAAFVGAVMGELRRRGAPAGAADPLLGLRDLAVPFLAAASLVIAALAWRSRTDVHERRPSTVAEAVGVPLEFLGESTRGQGGR